MKYESIDPKTAGKSSHPNGFQSHDILYLLFFKLTLVYYDFNKHFDTSFVLFVA
jgi:hypothetical protein